MNIKNFFTPIRDVPSVWKRRLLVVFWGIVLPPLFVLMTIFYGIKALGVGVYEYALISWGSVKHIARWYRDDLAAMWAKDYTPKEFI